MSGEIQKFLIGRAHQFCTCLYICNTSAQLTCGTLVRLSRSAQPRNWPFSPEIKQARYISNSKFMGKEGGGPKIVNQYQAINLIFRQGGIESIANDYSLRATPSYVAFGEKQRTMGVAAKSGQMTNVPKTFFGFKRLLGRKFDDPQVQDELTRFISGLLLFYSNNGRH